MSLPSDVGRQAEFGVAGGGEWRVPTYEAEKIAIRSGNLDTCASRIRWI